MLNQGCILMATGMGTVFSFLVVLWYAVSCMSRVVIYLNKLFPEAVKNAAVPVKAANNDAEIAIAIAAAKLKR